MQLKYFEIVLNTTVIDYTNHAYQIIIMMCMYYVYGTIATIQGEGCEDHGTTLTPVNWMPVSVLQIPGS